MTEEQQQEILQEDSEAEGAFSAGYRNVRGEEPSTEKEPAPSEQPPPADQGNEPAAEVQTEPETPIFEGLTPSQLKAKLGEIDQIKQQMQGETRRAFGKVGELNSRVQQLQEQLSTFQKQPEARRPTDLKRLREEFPDLAEILAEDLGGMVQTSDPKEVEKLVNERTESAIASVTKTMEERLLTALHPDWREIPDSEEFKAWSGTLKPEDLERLLDSEDGVSVANELTKFKAWRDANHKQKAAEQSAEKHKQERKNRIEAAAQPTGVAPAGVASEEDAFATGFKRVRGQKI